MNARLCVLALLLLPLAWLWPCVAGERVFLPYDTAQFPPASLLLSPDELAAARRGGNPDVTEPPVWFVPEIELAQRELAAGRLPTWNPHARCGAPLHAHGLLGLCYPPNWLLLLAAEPARAIAFVIWLNLALGGVLAFGLLRRLGLPLLPATFGAAAFELAAPLATNAFFWMRLGSFVWLPGVLWAVLATATTERLRRRHLAALGGSFAMTWLAGFPPFAATTTLLGLAFAAWLLAARWRADGAAPARAALLRLGAGFALGGCLALPQVLPSLRFFPESARPTQPAWQDIADQAFERYGLLGYVLPDAIAHPTAQVETPYPANNVLGLLWNARTDARGKPALPNYNYTEYAVFTGQLTLLLALLGALLGRGAHRGFAVLAWAGCAALALFLPGVRELFRLPLVQNVWPLRWLAPATLFVAWLAALGLQRLLSAGRALPAALGGIAAAGALLAALLPPTYARAHRADPAAVVQRLAAKYECSLETVQNHVHPPGTPPGLDRYAAAFARLAADGARAAWWFAGIAVWCAAFARWRSSRVRTGLAAAAGLAVVAQLGAHGASVTRGTVHARPPQTPVHAFLRQRAADFAAQGGFAIARGAADAVLPSQLPPGQLLVPGLRDLQFYSHFDGRSLQPLRHLLGSWLGTVHAGKGYLAAALPHTLPSPGLAALLANDPSVPADFAAAHPFEHPLLDLYGVRYVLSAGDAPLPHTGPVVAIPDAPAGFFVQERPTALPRAFPVDAVQPAAGDADVVRALLAADFAPIRRAHALAADLPATLPPPAAPDAVRRTVAFAVDEPTRVELEVGAGAQPWLLLADTFLPGWTATIDGQSVAIVRGNHAFRLLPLPATACRVVFRYAAPGLATGTWLALAALLGLLFFPTVRRLLSPARA